MNPDSAPDIAPGKAGCLYSPAQKLMPDLHRFKLSEPGMYTWKYRNNAQDEQILRLVVQAGFEHDWASVPRPLWMLIAPIDLGLAALFHDWLYHYMGQVETLRWQAETHTWEKLHKAWSRKDSDRLFARIMREQGVARCRRRLAFLAVRIFGYFYWD